MHRVYDDLCLTQTQALFDLVVGPAYVYSNYKHSFECSLHLLLFAYSGKEVCETDKFPC